MNSTVVSPFLRLLACPRVIARTLSNRSRATFGPFASAPSRCQGSLLIGLYPARRARRAQPSAR
jgi:hypothetical protein